MFQLIEHPDKGRMGVHSKGDLEYMLRRGWRVIKEEVSSLVSAPKAPEILTTKKRGRPPTRT